MLRRACYTYDEMNEDGTPTHMRNEDGTRHWEGNMGAHSPSEHCAHHHCIMLRHHCTMRHHRVSGGTPLGAKKRYAGDQDSVPHVPYYLKFRSSIVWLRKVRQEEEPMKLVESANTLGKPTSLIRKQLVGLVEEGLPPSGGTPPSNGRSVK